MIEATEDADLLNSSFENELLKFNINDLMKFKGLHHETNLLFSKCNQSVRYASDSNFIQSFNNLNSSISKQLQLLKSQESVVSLSLNLRNLNCVRKPNTSELEELKSVIPLKEDKLKAINENIIKIESRLRKAISNHDGSHIKHLKQSINSLSSEIDKLSLNGELINSHINSYRFENERENHRLREQSNQSIPFFNNGHQKVDDLFDEYI